MAYLSFHLHANSIGRARWKSVYYVTSYASHSRALACHLKSHTFSLVQRKQQWRHNEGSSQQQKLMVSCIKGTWLQSNRTTLEYFKAECRTVKPSPAKCGWKESFVRNGTTSLRIFLRDWYHPFKWNRRIWLRKGAQTFAAVGAYAGTFHYSSTSQTCDFEVRFFHFSGAKIILNRTKWKGCEITVSAIPVLH